MTIDLVMLRGLNVGLATPWLDRLVPPFSDLSLWKPVLLAMGLAIVLLKRREGILIVVGTLLAFLLGEFISSDLIKPLLDRPRPCEVVEWVRLLGSFCPRSPAFPSSHATNAFSVTTFLGFFFPRLRPVLWTVALFVAFSRVYMGVHWPLDVIGGAVLGVGCAFVCRWVLVRLRGLGLASR